MNTKSLVTLTLVTLMLSGCHHMGNALVAGTALGLLGGMALSQPRVVVVEPPQFYYTQPPVVIYNDGYGPYRKHYHRW